MEKCGQAEMAENGKYQAELNRDLLVKLEESVKEAQKVLPETAHTIRIKGDPDDAGIYDYPDGSKLYVEPGDGHFLMAVLLPGGEWQGEATDDGCFELY